MAGDSEAIEMIWDITSEQSGSLFAADSVSLRVTHSREP